MEKSKSESISFPRAPDLLLGKPVLVGSTNKGTTFLDFTQCAVRSMLEGGHCRGLSENQCIGSHVQAYCLLDFTCTMSRPTLGIFCGTCQVSLFPALLPHLSMTCTYSEAFSSSSLSLGTLKELLIWKQDSGSDSSCTSLGAVLATGLLPFSR